MPSTLISWLVASLGSTREIVSEDLLAVQTNPSPTLMSEGSGPTEIGSPAMMPAWGGGVGPWVWMRCAIVTAASTIITQATLRISGSLLLRRGWTVGGGG